MTILLNTWHPVNGEWVHIVQEEREGTILYFTNGEVSGNEFVHDLAYVFKPVKAPRYLLNRRRDEVQDE